MIIPRPTTYLLGICFIAALLAVPSTLLAHGGTGTDRQASQDDRYDRDNDRDRHEGHHRGHDGDGDRGGAKHRRGRNYIERDGHDRRDHHRHRRPADEIIEQWWRGLPGEVQRRQRHDYDRYRKLDPDRRDYVRERWQRFRDLPPEQQEQVHRRYRHWQELPTAERERLQHTWQHFRKLPLVQQELLRRELRALRDLPPEERDRRRQELHRRYFPDLPAPPPRESR
jgi:hypothetical protein